jgi:hypothetical protein
MTACEAVTPLSRQVSAIDLVTAHLADGGDHEGLARPVPGGVTELCHITSGAGDQVARAFVAVRNELFGFARLGHLVISRVRFDGDDSIGQKIRTQEKKSANAKKRPS